MCFSFSVSFFLFPSSLAYLQAQHCLETATALHMLEGKTLAITVDEMVMHLMTVHRADLKNNNCRCST